MGFEFFSIFDLFPVFFLIVLGIIIFTIAKGIGQWSKNNKEPVLSVIARVITKRTNVSSHMHDNQHHSSTTYYITFEVESGDRIEFLVSGREYGNIAEGDLGKLTFQGTRFHDFERR